MSAPGRSPTPNAPEPRTVPLEEPLPSANDPGGAHRKGYTADPGPARTVPEQGPVPLADDRDVRHHVRKPDQSQATGASNPGGEEANQRVLGADR